MLYDDPYNTQLSFSFWRSSIEILDSVVQDLKQRRQEIKSLHVAQDRLQQTRRLVNRNDARSDHILRWTNEAKQKWENKKTFKAWYKQQKQQRKEAKESQEEDSDQDMLASTRAGNFSRMKMKDIGGSFESSVYNKTNPSPSPEELINISQLSHSVQPSPWKGFQEGPFAKTIIAASHRNAMERRSQTNYNGHKWWKKGNGRGSIYLYNVAKIQDYWEFSTDGNSFPMRENMQYQSTAIAQHGMRYLYDKIKEQKDAGRLPKRLTLMVRLHVQDTGKSADANAEHALKSFHFDRWRTMMSEVGVQLASGPRFAFGDSLEGSVTMNAYSEASHTQHPNSPRIIQCLPTMNERWRVLLARFLGTHHTVCTPTGQSINLVFTLSDHPFTNAQWAVIMECFAEWGARHNAQLRGEIPFDCMPEDKHDIAFIYRKSGPFRPNRGYYYDTQVHEDEELASGQVVSSHGVQYGGDFAEPGKHERNGVDGAMTTSTAKRQRKGGD